MRADVSFNASYIGEAASDISNFDSSTTQFFGLAAGGFSATWTAGVVEYTAVANMLWLHGDNITNVLGDLNGVSNVAGVDAARLNHLSIEARAGAWRARFGRFDIDEDFMAFDSSASLLNSAFGALSTATANLPLPTYPTAGLALLFERRFGETGRIMTAIFDGDVGAESADLIGFELGSSGVGGVFAISQGDWFATYQRRPLRVMFGIAYHSGDFETLDGGGRKSSNGLIYWGAEHEIWQRSDRTLTGNIRFSAAPFDDRNLVTYQFDSGFSVTSVLVPGRDQLQFGIIYTDVSSDIEVPADRIRGEWVVETSYRLDVARQVSITPSVQYVKGAFLEESSDIVVGLIRFGIEY